jgi:hypothetical protein
MDMEQRKANWRNRIHAIYPVMDMAAVRAIASICQDAFNEGHKAGWNMRKDQEITPMKDGEEITYDR